MFRWLRPFSLALALACAVSRSGAAEDVTKPTAPGNRAAEKYVAEAGADLAALDAHFQKYREAAERLSALYAKLAAKAEELGRIGSAGGASQGQLLAATKQMQDMQMSLGPQFIQIQGQLQSESRSYLAVSGIMKTKHDTVKNAINNIR